MKCKPNNQDSGKSRRTFLQSMGVSVAGVSLMPSYFFGVGKNSSLNKQIITLNLNPENGFPPDEILPDGVKAFWDIGKAYHETTPTRERICINGLWKWQPGVSQSDLLPTASWGYFKVPGCWPGKKITCRRKVRECLLILTGAANLMRN